MGHLPITLQCCCHACLADSSTQSLDQSLPGLRSIQASRLHRIDDQMLLQAAGDNALRQHRCKQQALAAFRAHIAPLTAVTIQQPMLCSTAILFCRLHRAWPHSAALCRLCEVSLRGPALCNADPADAQLLVVRTCTASQHQVAQVAPGQQQHGRGAPSVTSFRQVSAHCMAHAAEDYCVAAGITQLWWMSASACMMKLKRSQKTSTVK